MAQIAVRPDQLNAIAQFIRDHSNRIQAAIQAVDAEMRRMNADTFAGQSADALRSRYNNVQQRLLSFAPMLSKFANQLDEAAAAFRKADVAESGTNRPTGGNWSMASTMTGSSGGAENIAERVKAIQEATQGAIWKLW
jgi:WXG100 family type VII secretion target